MEFIPWFGRFILLAVLYLFLLEALRLIAADLRVSEASPVRREEPADGHLPAVSVAGNGKGKAAIEVVASRGEPKLGVSFPIDGEIRIGRAAECQVAIPDVYVSNHHARLYALNGRYWVEDLQSTNGTLVNGWRVSAATPVSDGDNITVGPVTMQVRLSTR